MGKKFEKLLQSYIALNALEENSLNKLKKRYKDVLLKIFTFEDNEYFLEKLVSVFLTESNFEEAEHIIAQKLLEQLKSSKVRFSADGMKLIRFWSLGVNNA